MNRIALLLLLMLVAAACGGSDDTTATTSAPAPATTTTLASPTTTTTTTTTTVAPPTTTTAAPTTTTTAAPTTTTTLAAVIDAPAGYTVAADPDNTFQVALAEPYLIVPVSDEDVAGFLAEFDEEAADLIAQTIADGTTNFALWAFDFERGSLAFVPNVNIQVAERGPFDQIGLFEDAVPDQYASLGVELVLLERIDVPAGEALTVEGLFPYPGGVSYAMQLIVFGDERLYITTFSFAGEPTADQRTEAETAFQTFTPIESG